VLDPPEDGVVDEYVSAHPAPPLRPFVERYSGYFQRGGQPAVHRGLPSPYLTMILTLDDPLTIAAHPDPAQPGGNYETLIGGLHTRPAMITHSGRQSGVQLNLHPLGARLLLGLPAGQLGHLDVPAEAVMGSVALELQDRVREASTWAARFAALDATLLNLLRESELASSPIRSLEREVIRAWDLLRAGEVRVGAIAREVGWSTRHLSDRMAAETGLTPKVVARVLRFDRARRLLVRARPDRSVARVAAECGYFDQAHLAREFNALAGLPPSTWVREETWFRNVQAEGTASEEDDQHG
jgi:AraC-like DNA-binding protein